MNIVAERRLGMFLVPFYVLENEPLTLIAVLDKCIVIEATHNMEHDSIQYIAYHADFAPAPRGSIFPCYRAEITRISTLGDAVQHVGRVWKL